MSDPVFKYADATKRIVCRTWPNGMTESHLADSDAIIKWIAEGNVVIPADPVPPAPPQPPSDGELFAILKAKGLVSDADLPMATKP